MSDDNKDAKGDTNAQGAGVDNLDPGHAKQGSVAPKPEDTKKPTAAELNEEHDDPNAKPEDKEKAAKEKADKEAADKAEADKKAKEEENKDWHKEYVKTGHESADAAIDLLKEANVSPIEANAIFSKAIESGDLKDIPWHQLEDKIGKAKTTLVKAGVENFFREVLDKNRATVAQTFEVMGGEENWNKVKTWAQTKEKTDTAFKGEVDAIRGMLDKGGKQAELAAKELRRMYEADAKNNGLGTNKIIEGNTAPKLDGAPMTRAEYHAAITKAHNENAPKAVIANLQARRRAGMQAGI